MTLRRVASLAGALVVAAIAALASYSHMRGLALRYGQPELIADLLPISVDGMMVVATVALGDGRRNRWSAWAAFWTGVVASVIANVLAAEPSAIARCISAWPAVAFLLVIEVITRGGPGHTSPPADTAREAGSALPPKITPSIGPTSTPAEPAHIRTEARHAKPAARTRSLRRPLAQTRELAANLRAKSPGITQAELARQLGISATRLRQVERTEVPRERAAPTDRADARELREVSA
jgi:hypothetical protein